MISFDIKSLFTNVPTDEVIKIILDKAFSDKLRTKVIKRKVVVDKVEKTKSKSTKPANDKIKRVNDRSPIKTRARSKIAKSTKKVEVEFEVETFNGMERKELKVLLETALKKSHFQFNGTFFDQIDGVAMGSPLGPDVADMFMIWFENLYMEIIKAHGVVLWLRFVDDVFIDKANELMRILNSKHANIEFNIEK